MVMHRRIKPPGEIRVAGERLAEIPQLGNI
jgi:hypothetical protein